jgi:hypothetical protein
MTKNIILGIISILSIFQFGANCASLNDVHYVVPNDVSNEQIRLNFKQNTQDGVFNQEINEHVYKAPILPNQKYYSSQDDVSNNEMASHFEPLHQNIFNPVAFTNNQNKFVQKYNHNHQPPQQQKHIDLHYQKNIGI